MKKVLFAAWLNCCIFATMSIFAVSCRPGGIRSFDSLRMTGELQAREESDPSILSG
jgi:hypothetical protein